LKQLAKGCCEYCKCLEKFSPSEFTTDHIIPISLGGTNNLLNLARACQACNGSKYTATTAIDPASGDEVPLFHPRKDKWNNHFEWTKDLLQMRGKSPTGRATIVRLKTNRPAFINLRQLLIDNGHPPD
jgi:5-methylcytosine-specific restriction endonuclease McrA